MELQLIQTCSACPEQYDVFYKNLKVGYLRLRHGEFTVEYPDCGGELLYFAYPKGDGMFDDNERDAYLMDAERVILDKLKNKVIIDL